MSIRCDIIYDDDSDLKGVKILREVLNKVYREKFFFSTRTYKHAPVELDGEKEAGR